MIPNDNELIVLAQKGDLSAFEELIYRHDKQVLGLALKYTGNSDDAQDIYQEVFIRVFKGLPKFRFESEFSTWLFRIVTNCCITFKRKSSKPGYLSLDDESNYNYLSGIPDEDQKSPDDMIINTEMGNSLKKAINNLSPNQKMSFLLKHNEGYKIREIAQIMKCKEGTIKKYLFDAARKLKMQLQGIY